MTNKMTIDLPSLPTEFRQWARSAVITVDSTTMWAPQIIRQDGIEKEGRRTIVLTLHPAFIVQYYVSLRVEYSDCPQN